MCQLASIPQEPVLLPLAAHFTHPFNTLTLREQQVAFVLASKGICRKQLAEFFHIHIKTVDMHISKIYSKLSIKHNHDPLWELVVKMLKWKILEAEELFREVS
jgi:DNA-binding NarL/FixJ family response regulator